MVSLNHANKSFEDRVETEGEAIETPGEGSSSRKILIWTGDVVIEGL